MSHTNLKIKAHELALQVLNISEVIGGAEGITIDTEAMNLLTEQLEFMAGRIELIYLYADHLPDDEE